MASSARRGRLAVAVAALLCAAPPVAAETFRFEGGTLEIPAGFSGPTEQRRGSDLVLYGFAKPHPGRETSTLLQVTVITGVPENPKDEDGRAPERYLLEFLGGIERRRTDFSRGAVETITIGGRAVARVSWRGRAEGQPMAGVMYVYLHGPRLVSFHTQDFDFAPPETMAAAVRAFETATLGDGADRGAPKR